jgi:hypothetical protein
LVGGTLTIVFAMLWALAGRLLFLPTGVAVLVAALLPARASHRSG